jgi:hypothetical protein
MALEFLNNDVYFGYLVRFPFMLKFFYLTIFKFILIFLPSPGYSILVVQVLVLKKACNMYIHKLSNSLVCTRMYLQ